MLPHSKSYFLSVNICLEKRHDTNFRCCPKSFGPLKSLLDTLSDTFQTEGCGIVRLRLGKTSFKQDSRLWMELSVVDIETTDR